MFFGFISCFQRLRSSVLLWTGFVLFLLLFFLSKLRFPEFGNQFSSESNKSESGVPIEVIEAAPTSLDLLSSEAFFLDTEYNYVPKELSLELEPEDQFIEPDILLFQ